MQEQTRALEPGLDQVQVQVQVWVQVPVLQRPLVRSPCPQASHVQWLRHGPQHC